MSTQEPKLMYVVTDPDQPEKFEQKMHEKDPESKKYLVCIVSADPESHDEWVLADGRTEAREYIKDCAGFIDFENSFVLVENLPLKERISVYKFMKHIEQFYPDDPFDVDDYVKGDFEDTDVTDRPMEAVIDPIFNEVQRLTPEEWLRPRKEE